MSSTGNSEFLKHLEAKSKDFFENLKNNSGSFLEPSKFANIIAKYGVDELKKSFHNEAIKILIEWFNQSDFKPDNSNKAKQSNQTLDFFIKHPPFAILMAEAYNLEEIKVDSTGKDMEKYADTKKIKILQHHETMHQLAYLLNLGYEKEPHPAVSNFESRESFNEYNNFKTNIWDSLLEDDKTGKYAFKTSCGILSNAKNNFGNSDNPSVGLAIAKHILGDNSIDFSDFKSLDAMLEEYVDKSFYRLQIPLQSINFADENPIKPQYSHNKVVIKKENRQFNRIDWINKALEAIKKADNRDLPKNDKDKFIKGLEAKKRQIQNANLVASSVGSQKYEKISDKKELEKEKRFLQDSLNTLKKLYAEGVDCSKQISEKEADIGFVDLRLEQLKHQHKSFGIKSIFGLFKKKKHIALRHEISKEELGDFNKLWRLYKNTRREVIDKLLEQNKNAF